MSREGSHDGVPLDSLRDCCIWADGEGRVASFCPRLQLRCVGFEGETTIAIVPVCEHGGALVVAVPQSVWHRRAAGRLLAKGSLLRPHQVEVAAVLEEGASPHSVLTVKLWLAVLDSQLESIFEECVGPDAPVHDFVAASSSVPVRPDVDGLIAAADNLFQFVSAAEGPPGFEAPPPAQPWEQHVSSLESSLASIQASLAQLVSSWAHWAATAIYPSAPPPGLASAPALPSRSYYSQDGRSRDVLSNGRCTRRLCSAGPRSKTRNPLSKSEEEAEDEGFDPSIYPCSGEGGRSAHACCKEPSWRQGPPSNSLDGWSRKQLQQRQALKSRSLPQAPHVPSRCSCSSLRSCGRVHGRGFPSLDSRLGRTPESFRALSGLYSRHVDSGRSARLPPAGLYSPRHVDSGRSARLPQGEQSRGGSSEGRSCAVRLYDQSAADNGNWLLSQDFF